MGSCLSSLKLSYVYGTDADERVELLYNLGVTRWSHVTADLQVITPILERAETSLVLGLRAKIDF